MKHLELHLIKIQKKEVRIVSDKAGANTQDVEKSYDDNELSEWGNDGALSTAWITYKLERVAEINDICLKLRGWRRNSYPLEVYAGKTLIWKGNTDKSLGYIHLETIPVRTDEITISLKGSATESDAFGEIVEVAATVTNKMELQDNKQKGKRYLKIIEVEFLENVK